mmetsp:Transcript_3124/g.8842  ORF Transcript_3124/g.8842 Transcript_3124/m.8842 type:complete len:94 (-) Transcript_3124:241-522(-)
MRTVCMHANVGPPLSRAPCAYQLLTVQVPSEFDEDDSIRLEGRVPSPFTHSIISHHATHRSEDADGSQRMGPFVTMQRISTRQNDATEYQKSI